MKLICEVKAVYPAMNNLGVMRTYTSKDGETYDCWQVELAVPYYTSKGEKRYDTILCDHSRKRTEENSSATPFADVIGVENCMASISFSVRLWEGKRFNNVYLSNISKQV